MRISDSPGLDPNDIYYNVTKINIPFPQKKFETLLKKLKIKAKEKYTDIETQLIFINSIYLFLIGKLSQDELSNIALKHWSTKNIKTDEIGDALYKCSELSFYSRRIYNPQNPELHGDYVWFMTEVMKYYNYYKRLVLTEEKA